MVINKSKCITEYYSKDKVKLFLAIFFLIAGIILPSFVSIRNSAKREVESRQYELDLVGEIIKGSSFQEKIYLPKHISKYGVMFATYGRKNTGKIKIEIIQGNKKNSKIVDVTEIKDNDYYYLNIKGLKSGEAILRVEGINGTIGNAVSMHKTADIMYNEMIQNGQPSHRSFVQKILFYEYDGIVKGQIIFTILSVICYIYFLSLLGNEEKNNRKIYVSTVLLIYLIVASRAPVLTFKVEPFAEQVFNFLYNARTYGVFKNLTLMEGGYLPLFHRIIALMIVKLGFNAKITVYLMSNIAVVVVGMMVSVFTLNRYRKYGDIFYRFVVCMVFGAFGISTYSETHTFITMAYLNIVPLFCISLLDFRKMKRWRFVLLMLLVFLLVLSKFLYVVLLPISVAILIFMWRKLVNREKIYLGLVLLATSIQILYAYRNKDLWVNENRPELKVSNFISNVLHQSVQQFVNIFNSGIDSSQNILNLNILYLMIFLMVLVFLLYLIIRSKSRESIIILCLVGITFGVSSINVLSRIWSGNYELWSNSLGAINMWHSILIKVSILLILVLMPYVMKIDRRFNRSPVMIEYLSYIIIVFLVIRFSPLKNETIYKNNKIASDWSIYSKFYDSGKYLIPVEPYFISENEKVTYVGKSINSFAVNTFQGEKYFINELSTTEAITGINLPHPMKIEYLYVRRARDYSFEKTRVIGYDNKGNKVLDLLQLNKPERTNIGFHNTDSKVEISRLEFVTEENNKTYVIPEIFIGEPLK